MKMDWYISLQANVKGTYTTNVVTDRNEVYTTLQPFRHTELDFLFWRLDLNFTNGLNQFMLQATYWTLHLVLDSLQVNLLLARLNKMIMNLFSTKH